MAMGSGSVSPPPVTGNGHPHIDLGHVHRRRRAGPPPAPSRRRGRGRGGASGASLLRSGHAAVLAQRRVGPEPVARSLRRGGRGEGGRRGDGRRGRAGRRQRRSRRAVAPAAGPDGAGSKVTEPRSWPGQLPNVPLRSTHFALIGPVRSSSGPLYLSRPMFGRLASADRDGGDHGNRENPSPLATFSRCINSLGEVVHETLLAWFRISTGVRGGQPTPLRPGLPRAGRRAAVRRRRAGCAAPGAPRARAPGWT